MLNRKRTGRMSFFVSRKSERTGVRYVNLFIGSFFMSMASFCRQLSWNISCERKLACERSIARLVINAQDQGLLSGEKKS